MNSIGIFIAGLVVGGLAVWGFLSMPMSAVPEVETPVEEVAEEDGAQQSGSASTPKPSAPQKVWVKDHYEWIVNLNNGTFSPAVITIKKGETIQFVNKDNLAMRISATLENPPSSPISDANSVAKGGTYSLSFTKAGKWSITNLSDPKSGKGAVNVTE